MLIFTIPKAFDDVYGKIQEDAIMNWLLTTKDIVLFGDEDGIAEVAEFHNLKHIPDIKKNEYGTPLVSSAFHTMFHLYEDEIKCYINTDVQISGLQKAIEHVKHLDRFLVIGRRYDNLEDGSTVLHSPDAIDYFLYKGILHNLPPFAVGRCFWDNYIVAYYLTFDIVPVIDGSEVILALHQHHPMCGWDRMGSKEVNDNKKLTEGLYAFITDASLVLTSEGLTPR